MLPWFVLSIKTWSPYKHDDTDILYAAARSVIFDISTQTKHSLLSASHQQQHWRLTEHTHCTCNLKCERVGVGVYVQIPTYLLMC